MAILVLVAIGLALLVGSIRPTPRPLALTLMNVGPAGMVDSAGKQTLLVDLRITNQRDAYLYISETGSKIEARIGNRLVEAGSDSNDFYLSRARGFLHPRDRCNMLFVMPRDTEVCRLSLNIQLEPICYRLWRKLGPRSHNLLLRVLPKELGRKMSAPWPMSLPAPSGRKLMILEVNRPIPSGVFNCELIGVH